MPAGIRLNSVAVLLAAALACEPPRAPDIAGVVTAIWRDPAARWKAMVEADPTDPGVGGRETPKVEVSLTGPAPRALRVGCRVRVWYTNGGMALLSYPGQAWAEALRIDACPRDAPRPSRPAA